MTSVMVDEDVSVFATRLRESARERSELLERERQWLHQQLDGLRAKAVDEPRRGRSMRRFAGV